MKVKEQRLKKDKDMEKSQIDKMVDNFLSWKLPEDFCPDGVVVFNSHVNDPTLTNLFTAEQAREMILHMLGMNTDPDVVTVFRGNNVSVYNKGDKEAFVYHDGDSWIVRYNKGGCYSDWSKRCVIRAEAELEARDMVTSK